MERKAFRVSGFAVVLGLLVLAGVVGAVAATGNEAATGVAVVLGALVFALVVSGFTVVGPNEARVIQFFGRYVGTVASAGFHWVIPLTTKRRLSQRVSNFETARLKVADADGNPVEIAAVVVWRVSDTYRAAFGVDDYAEYVSVQSE